MRSQYWVENWVEYRVEYCVQYEVSILGLILGFHIVLNIRFNIVFKYGVQVGFNIGFVIKLNMGVTLKSKIAFLVLPFITFPPFLSYNIRYHIIFSTMLNYTIANNFILLMLNYINANNLILMWTQTPSNEQDQIPSIELISYLNTRISH